MWTENTDKKAEKPSTAADFGVRPPAIVLPKGGGAIRGIGEKFTANPATGTGSLSVPIATSTGRGDFGPKLALSYDSGAGNGPFGFGWSMSLPAITRKTDKGLPKYHDAAESDDFVLSGAEDLVPVYRPGPDGTAVRDEVEIDGYLVRRYRPRVEGLFARIERWSRIGVPADVHWRSISIDNMLTLYGHDDRSRIADPLDPRRIFTWLTCETRDVIGNAVVYDYRAENGHGVDLGRAHERNRGAADDRRRTANRYPARIRYGNRTPLLDADGQRPRTVDSAQMADTDWMFEVAFDYGEYHPDRPKPSDAGSSAGWSVRPDPFSSYRSGFEVRTLRRCRRVLMFHHFPDAAEVGRDCLVRATEFTYSADSDPAVPVYTFLREVTEIGYRRTADGYHRRSMPPVAFEYGVPVVQDTVREVDAASLENLPAGVDGRAYRWTDLHGEGLPGVLTEQAGTWFYKRNLSPLADDSSTARFGPREVVALAPNVPPGAHFLDLDGDGRPDVVVTTGADTGVYPHDDAEGWLPFRPFAARPTHALDDPGLRFVDLDGDGFADLLVPEDDALGWHPALAGAGFGESHRVPWATDEEHGPRVIFTDGTETISLADLSGDGLPDLVRIRNGEVCYWPGLGYGRFGAKVTMDDAPWFDNADQFEDSRIRLVDIDGSGTTDLVYLHRDGIRLYFNQSGNGWSPPRKLDIYPSVDELATIVPADLLGNGTACLVWSSVAPAEAGRPMRYVDLMGGRKPHLLIGVSNNMGAETHIDYAPSTRFFLRDKRDGRPWLTRLPFPVQVVERVSVYDHVSRNRFVTEYAYHHGYFDPVEREFRGFGMVEQRDTEAFGAFGDADNAAIESHVPPVLTKSWFDTGAPGPADRFEREYFREPGLTLDEARALRPAATTLPPGLSPEEQREAHRALRGTLLRQEIYAEDAGPEDSAARRQRAHSPYSVTEHSFTVRMLQRRGDNRHGVFHTHGREVLTLHYERDPADPRVQHALTLEVDDFGLVLKNATIGYGRRALLRTVDAAGRVGQVPNPALAELSPDDRRKQTTALLTYVEHRVTNAVDSVDAHRGPQRGESKTFELTGYQGTGPDGRIQPSDLVELDPAAPQRLRHRFIDEVPYEAAATANPCRRVVEWQRTLYRRDDLTDLLPLGTVQPLALPGESYRLAFTPGLLAQVYRRPVAGQPPEVLLPDPAAVLGGRGGAGGGYQDSRTLVAAGLFPADDAEGHWWLPSGRVFFSVDTADTAAAEAAQARAHFFVPRRYRDPFDVDIVADLDADDLLTVRTVDALGNNATVLAADYRTLQPSTIRDPNGNRSEVVYDALGMVAGTAAMGKQAPAPVEGDTLDEFVSDPAESDLAAFFDAADPEDAARVLLHGASMRVVYDLDRFRRTRLAHPAEPQRWQPICAATLARETHVSDAQPPGGGRIQIGFGYSDGFGREIQRKVQAEPGPVTADGPIVRPRWVGSGWTVFDNKGNPVRKYEPFFSSTLGFEFGVRAGVSPVLFYDPIGRVVATLLPNQTYQKVVFDPWRQLSYDANDTCAPCGTQTGDPRTDPDIGGYVARYFASLDDPAAWRTWYAQRVDGSAGEQERVAAERAAEHADTPTAAHADVLGRTVLTEVGNRIVCAGHELDGTSETLSGRVDFDIEGNQLAIRDSARQDDPLGRVVVRNAYNMVGARIHVHSMEAGARWLLDDVDGTPIRAWDSRGHRVVTSYDELRRPLRTTVRGSVADGPGASDPRTLDRDVVVSAVEYGEPPIGADAESEARAQRLNLRTRVYRQFDGAGVLTNARLDAAGNPMEACDFKGNLRHTTRRLVRDYVNVPDWQVDPELDNESFEASTCYDALNRPIQSLAPRSSRAGTARTVLQPVFNEAGLLDRVSVWLAHPDEPTALLDPATEPPDPVGVTNIGYDAKGQRLFVDYVNGARTRYSYDPDTFRLTRLRTGRPVGDDLQDLRYTYDPTGNLTHVHDAAQQSTFFRNRRVEPSNDYIYDAVYRLLQATGREQLGGPADQYLVDDVTVPVDHPGDGNAMGGYLERYVYDAVGNILRMQHRGMNPAHPGWTRGYRYAERSALDRGSATAEFIVSNRLSSTTVERTGTPVAELEPYSYDSHGNTTHLRRVTGDSIEPDLHWDYGNRLTRVELGGGGAAYYVYDAAGQRLRKVWEKAPGRVEERIYLGGVEVFRRHAGPIGADTATLERTTLHVTDDKRRIALVESRTRDTAGTDPAPERTIRYQLANHLGSSALELDDQARIISYEEYAPYGTTTYQAVRRGTEAPKRYRYTGKERDEESGLYYHGARYYAPWLGRWTACDPAGLVDGPNLYAYVGANPVRKVDATGTQDGDPPLFDPGDIDNALSQGEASWEQRGKVSEIPGTMDIDEAKAVGEKGISQEEAYRRATSVEDRQFLESITNRRTKHVRTDMRPMQSRPPVSVTSNPNVLLDRNFGEISEMREIFDEALAKVTDPNKLTPTKLKAAINANMRDIIKNGTSDAAVKVRKAIGDLGFQNIEGKGWTLPAAPRPNGTPQVPATTPPAPAPKPAAPKPAAPKAPSGATGAAGASAQEAKTLVAAEAKALAATGPSEAGLLARVGGGAKVLGRVAVVVNVYFAYEGYKEGAKHSEGEAVLNFVGGLGGLPEYGTILRQGGEFGSMVSKPGKLWDAIKGGSSPQSIGMGMIFGSFR
ncbi:SpvB/TcaC N-terminal domain-containing protein [Nocardia goodfellowii]|uniref:RHS repeat-associated protein n=1 Tax=Nocardia goodfellowii TaxID=882446 RepID=A0ABS4QL95_9NOCA|nr:SpvB/TcaC N-terminal domain-containing protein [Nocardia goodfellowii]MBP2192479.1 RHS repeat-associated protein [Nocardia goodfellowii]